MGGDGVIGDLDQPQCTHGTGRLGGARLGIEPGWIGDECERWP